MSKYSKYVPIHVHTSRNSVGDSILRLDDYINKAKELGLDTLCITGHGSLADMYDFYFKCIKNNIKPIIGCEIYITPDMTLKDKTSETYHLILLAKNNKGLENLLNIVSIASLEGFYKYPRVDLNYIKEHSEGLICTTACVGGMIPQYILNNNLSDDFLVEKSLSELKDIFKDDLYLEIQPGEFEEQKIVNNALIYLSYKCDIPLVISNDIHYLNEEDYIIHDYHVRIGRGKTISDDSYLLYPDKCYWFMSYDELHNSMSEYDLDIVNKAIDNTLEIGNKCNINIDIKELNLPEFEVPYGYTLRTYIEHLCYERLEQIQYKIKYPNQYIDRLEYELDTLEELDYLSYMLIMWDIYRYARERNILMGPGRGSVAGSLVAYLLQLVTIDPIKYNLLFERFTSKHRKGSIPDIDMDCPSEYREEMFKYVIDKYGIENCAAVSTFAIRKAKSAIRDTCRLLEIDLQTADIIAKLIPSVYYLDDDDEEDKLVDLSIQESLDHVEELRDYERIYPELFTIAKKLEGLESNTSIHAAGTLITKNPVMNTMPMIRQKDKELQATALELRSCESVKSVKYDFLGLNTLDIIMYCQELTGYEFDVEFDACDDESVWNLISSNKTTGLFQIGTDTYKKRMPRLKPKSIDELAACLALVRGPCISAGSDETYMRILENKEKVHYIHPFYDLATKDTNGILLFQEQLMDICVNMGTSLEKGFQIMKFSSKKAFDKLKDEEPSLRALTKETMTNEEFNKVFTMIIESGKYLFNRSHAVSYAMLGYITAFYKYYYPREFIASTLSYLYMSSIDAKKKKEKLREIYKDARRLGIKFLPVDITKSSWKFTIEDKAIRIGLCSITSFSKIAYDEILDKCPKFNSDDTILSQIMRKVEKNKCGKTPMTPLILSGAVGDRIDCYNEFCELRKEECKSEIYIHKNLTIDLYSSDMEIETALFGIPFTTYAINDFEPVDIENKKNNEVFTIKSYILKIKKHKTKINTDMWFLTFDTGDGEIDLVVFEEVYSKFKQHIKKNKIINAKIKKTNRGLQLIGVEV